jgi:hypothetical protein
VAGRASCRQLSWRHRTRAPLPAAHRRSARARSARAEIPTFSRDIPRDAPVRAFWRAAESGKRKNTTRITCARHSGGPGRAGPRASSLHSDLLTAPHDLGGGLRADCPGPSGFGLRMQHKSRCPRGQCAHARSVCHHSPLTPRPRCAAHRHSRFSCSRTPRSRSRSRASSRRAAPSSFASTAHARCGRSPPAGVADWSASLTGRARQGEFATIGAAVAALPADNSIQVVFVYPGTYAEQVNVTRGGHTTVRCPCCPPLGGAR